MMSAPPLLSMPPNPRRRHTRRDEEDPMRQVRIEHQKSRATGVLAAIFEELGVAPEDVPEEVFMLLAREVVRLCAVIACSARRPRRADRLRCPRCGCEDLEHFIVTDEIGRVWRHLALEEGVLIASGELLIADACTESRFLCVPCGTEFDVPRLPEIEYR